MAVIDPADGYEITASYCTDENADESTVGAVWTTLTYAKSFKITRNNNTRDVYNKRTKVCSKAGRQEYTGSLSQLYTIYTVGLSKIFEDGLPVALKLEIDKDLTGNVDETKYLSNVTFRDLDEDMGDLNDGGDVVCTCNFTFAECHTV